MRITIFVLFFLFLSITGCSSGITPLPAFGGFRAIAVYNGCASFDISRAMNAVDKAVEYGLEAVVLCDECLAGGFVDGCIDFIDYPEIAESETLTYKSYFTNPDGSDLDVRKDPKEARHKLNQIIEAAHNKGLSVYIWQHELRYPHELETIKPLWFNDDVEPLLWDSEVWWTYTSNRLAEFFDLVPDIDGIIVTSATETTFKINDVQGIKKLTEILYGVCRPLGKDLVMRPFSPADEDYLTFVDAMAQVPEDVIVMSKITQSDWHLSLPANPYLGSFGEHPFWVEFDLCGEYWGCGEIIGALPVRLTEWLKGSINAGAKGFVGRIDRGRHTLIDTPNEYNLYLLSKCFISELPSPYVSLQLWCEKHFASSPETASIVLKECEDILLKAFYIEDPSTSLHQWFLGGQTRYFWLPVKNKSWYSQIHLFDEDGTLFDYPGWMYIDGWHCPGHDAILSEKKEALESMKELVNLLKESQDSEIAQLLEKAEATEAVVNSWYHLAQGYAIKWNCDYKLDYDGHDDYLEWSAGCLSLKDEIESNSKWGGAEFYRWKEYPKGQPEQKLYDGGLSSALAAFVEEDFWPKEG